MTKPDRDSPRYLPTPKELEEAKAKIRLEWTPEQYEARLRGGWGCDKSEDSGPITYKDPKGNY